MKLSEEYTAGSNIIRAYDEQMINVNGRAYSRSLLLSNQTLIDNWPVNHVDQLDTVHFDQLLELSPEVIIIGTGSKLSFPHPENYAHVINRNIGIEFMDTGAACRTYNILLSEDRRVVAGLIL